MALYGAFAADKHLSELDEPLVTQEGVLTPAQRRARAIANLFGDDDDVTADLEFSGDVVFSGTVDFPAAMTEAVGAGGNLDGADAAVIITIDGTPYYLAAYDDNDASGG